jgi:hypothetical protein
MRKEQPTFTFSVELGLTMLYLIDKFGSNEKILPELENLVQIQEIKESINEALKYYRKYNEDSRSISLRRTEKYFPEYYEAVIITSVKIEKGLFHLLAN